MQFILGDVYNAFITLYKLGILDSLTDIGVILSSLHGIGPLFNGFYFMVLVPF